MKKKAKTLEERFQIESKYLALMIDKVKSEFKSTYEYANKVGFDFPENIYLGYINFFDLLKPLVSTIEYDRDTLNVSKHHIRIERDGLYSIEFIASSYRPIFVNNEHVTFIQYIVSNNKRWTIKNNRIKYNFTDSIDDRNVSVDGYVYLKKNSASSSLNLVNDYIINLVNDYIRKFDKMVYLTRYIENLITDGNLIDLIE